MSEGLTFPQNPQDGETVSFQFTHTGGEANSSVVVKSWSWNESRQSWVANYANGSGIIGGGVGSQGPTGTIGNIVVGETTYQDVQTLNFYSDHSITHSYDNNTLNITFGSELGSISGNTKENGVARWEYIVYSADFDGSWIVSSPSVTAMNLLEINNTTSNAYGTSLTGSEGVTLSGFTGFSVNPVPNGTIVELIYKNGNYFFSAPNPIDGVC